MSIFAAVPPPVVLRVSRLGCCFLIAAEGRRPALGTTSSTENANFCPRPSPRWEQEVKRGCRWEEGGQRGSSGDTQTFWFTLTAQSQLFQENRSGALRKLGPGAADSRLPTRLWFCMCLTANGDGQLQSPCPSPVWPLSDLCSPSTKSYPKPSAAHPATLTKP